MAFIRTPENFPVNGVTINIRSSELIIATWLKQSTEAEKSEIKNWLKDVLGLVNASCL